MPTYTLTNEVEDMTIRAINSYRDQVDIFIVSEDGGIFSNKIRDAVDVYLYNKKNLGFTGNVNILLQCSNAEYNMVVNSDTYLIKGSLNDLCISGKVTSPFAYNEPHDNHTGMLGYFFVVPREVRNSRGLLLEDLKMYGSDSEFEERVADIYKHVPTVEIMHDWNKSSNQIPGLWEKLRKQSKKDVYTLNDVIKKGGLLNDKRNNAIGKARGS